MRNIKQIAVVRTKYSDNKGGFRGLRTGKIVSQINHAFFAFLSYRINVKNGTVDLTEAQKDWFGNRFTKIVLQVDFEETLLDVYNKGKEAGLEVYLITDSGKTEFGGVETNTCIGFAPEYSDKLEPITGHLKLY